MLTIQLFGAATAQFEGETLSFRSAKVRALLAYLVVRANELHRREFLAALFWGEMPDKQAQRNLRVTLSRLRRSLLPAIEAGGEEQPLLEITRQTVRLNLPGEGCRVDVLAFREALDACQARPPDEWWRWADCIPRLQEAAALYTDEFLAGLYLADSPEFEAWRLAQADQFHRQMRLVLEALARHSLALGGYHEALQYARRLLAMEPWQEVPHRLIMRAHAALGQPEMALRQLDECRSILEEELGTQPEARTKALAAEIQQGSAIPPAPAAGGLTPFVGREAELDWLKARLLDPAHRLLTLAGPGGIGKTRLAQTAAAHMEGYFDSGTCFVALAEVNGSLEPEQSLLAALVNALEIPVKADRPLAEQTIDFLRERETLLILDGFEGVETARGLLLDALDAAPRLNILVTSRTRLNCPQETVFHLKGLPTPPPNAGPQALNYASVQLFLGRARRYLPHFDPSPEVLNQIGQLCRLTEGMPLALLLAATWIEEFSCAEIVAAVRQNIELLARRYTGILSRQRSMAAVFEHSWAHLSPAEQETLARLSLFPGEFGRPAATAVASASPSALSILTAKSMIEAAGSGRYYFHPLLRQMAGEKLTQAPAASADAIARYVAWYAGFLQEQKAGLDGGDEQHRAALAALRQEAANVQHAWRLALKAGHLTSAQQMAGPLAAFYEETGQYETGLTTFAAARRELENARQTDSPAYAQVLLYLAQFLERARRYGEAIQVLQQMLAHESVAADETSRAEGYYRLGCCQMHNGELEAALSNLAAAERLFSRLESDRGMSMVLSAQGNVLRLLGQYAAARQRLELSLQVRRQIGNPGMLSIGLTNLGFLLIRMGDYDRAISLLAECLELDRRRGHQPRLIASLINLGLAHMNKEAWPEAQKYLAEALEMSRKVKDRETEAVCLNNLGDIAASRGAYAQAVEYLKASLSIKREMGNEVGIPFSLLHLARAYLGLGRRQQAGEMLREAERQAEALKLRPLWLACQVEIARLLLATGRQQEAARRLAVVQNDPASWAHTRRQAAALMADIVTSE